MLRKEGLCIDFPVASRVPYFLLLAPSVLPASLLVLLTCLGTHKAGSPRPHPHCAIALTSGFVSMAPTSTRLQHRACLPDGAAKLVLQRRGLSSGAECEGAVCSFPALPV